MYKMFTNPGAEDIADKVIACVAAFLLLAYAAHLAHDEGYCGRREPCCVNRDAAGRVRESSCGSPVGRRAVDEVLALPSRTRFSLAPFVCMKSGPSRAEPAGIRTSA